jgi:hypothetical protein
MHPDLQRIVDATPSGNLTFLCTSHGAPFTAAGFGNWFRDACRAAGLPERCAAHGLRKAACRRGAEANWTHRGSATWQFGHRGSHRGRRHRPEPVRSRPRLCIRRLAALWSTVVGSASLPELSVYGGAVFPLRAHRLRRASHIGRSKFRLAPIGVGHTNPQRFD